MKASIVEIWESQLVLWTISVRTQQRSPLRNV